MRALVVVALALAPATASAENLENWLVGPLVGVRLGGPPGNRLVLGIEGGYGLGPERFNLGFEHRDKMFYYAEIDPWYIVGGTFGIGVDEDSHIKPVLGVWEGLPLTMDAPCSGWHTQVSISAGYRYTGAHELYLSLKAGRMDGNFCFN